VLSIKQRRAGVPRRRGRGVRPGGWCRAGV